MHSVGRGRASSGLFTPGCCQSVIKGSLIALPCVKAALEAFTVCVCMRGDMKVAQDDQPIRGVSHVS